MHLSEGVLHTPILLAGAVLAVAGIAVGLRRLESERLPLTALLRLHFCGRNHSRASWNW